MISRPPYTLNPWLYPTVIAFDNLADGTVVDMLYAAKGVTFESFVDTPAAIKWSAFARYDPDAESAKNVISINAASGSPPTNSVTPFFSGDFGGIRATFAKLQRSVSIDTLPSVPAESGGTPVARPFLQTFDAQGNVILTIFGDPNNETWQPLVCLSSSANISSAVFSTEPSNGGVQVSAAFDRLVFAEGLYRIILGGWRVTP